MKYHYIVLKNNLNFGHKIILFFAVSIIFFLTLFYNFGEIKDNILPVELDSQLCKYNYLSFSGNFSNEIVILDIENKSKSLSLYPEFDNLICLGKVVDYEITFYEEVGNSIFIKLRLYSFTNQKLIHSIKILLVIMIIGFTYWKSISKLFSKNLIVCFLIYLIFLINLFFSLQFDILNFIFDSIFYSLFFLFLNLDKKKMKFINPKHNISIDSLRAVGVIAVIFNHFEFKVFASGYLGVDLFFVISGFVITNKYLSSKHQRLKSFYFDFIFFRVRRIIPALVFFVLVTSFFVYFLDYNYKDTLQVGLFSTFALSNIYLYFRSLDYFSNVSSLNSFTHTWSLGVEEQFYLLFPLIIYGILKNKFSKNTLLLLTVLSAIYFYYSQVSDPNGTYYLIQYRFWQISLGCILVLYQKELKNLLNKIPLNILLFFLIASFTVSSPYDRNLTLLATILSTLILLIVGNENRKSKILQNPKLATIGVLSYSLYLWHWPVITLSKWSNVKFVNFEFQILLIIFLSVISFKYVEQPFRNISIQQAKKFITYILTLVVVVALALLIIVNNTDRNNILRGSNPYLFEEKDFENIVNKIECYHPDFIDTAFEKCMDYDEKKYNVFLIGDSHSTNHFYSLESIFSKFNNYNFNHLVEWGFIRDMQGIKGCAPTQSCIENSFEKHLDFFRNNLKENDIVVFSFSRDWFKIPGDMPRENIELKLRNFDENFNQLVEVIKSKEATLVIVDDIPKTCSPRVNYLNDIILSGKLEICTIDKNISLDDRMIITNIYIKVTGDKIIYLDPHDYFCDDSKCSIIDIETNKILYTDLSPHISKNGLNKLNLFWSENIDKLISN